MKAFFFRLAGGATLLSLLWITPAGATAPTTDCVIQQNNVNWALNQDGSAAIKERLTVDCGTLAGKHGIFRTLPTQVPNGTRPAKMRTDTPVNLQSITDDGGKSYQYSTSHDGSTVTWKIGDPNVAIQGIHQYNLAYTIGDLVWPDPQTGKYHVDLNLLGSFWQLPTDSFSATVTFPTTIDFDARQATKLYHGAFGSSSALDGATITWPSTNTLTLTTTGTFGPQDGVTASLLTAPDSFATGSLQLTWWQLYGGYLAFLWPILTLILAWRIWARYGKDAKLNKALMVQYEPPKELTSPLLLYQLQKNGRVDGPPVTATIIDLAVRGYLKLEEKDTKVLGFTKKDILIHKVKEADDGLSLIEKNIFNDLTTAGDGTGTVSLGDLKNSFYTTVAEVKRQGAAELKQRYYFQDGTNKLIPLLVVSFLVAFALSAVRSLLNADPLLLALAGFLGVVGPAVFMILMGRRTPAGAEIEWQLRGFQDYLKTAERYRLAFSEKENLFEKYLPYAIAFGLVTQWANAMKQLYGEQYWNSYMPLWYVGSFDHFQIDTFTANLNSVTSQMNSALTSSPSSSGGGGGFAGGGGGGGGGGSW